MLAELYIEALLVDEDLADQVWELWNAGVITGELAVWARWLVSKRHPNSSVMRLFLAYRRQGPDHVW
jgi:hypothetical protein